MEPKKILFANVPADGHFNPLTGLAMHLKRQGHDVRWYTQKLYKEKIEKMDIPYYPFVRPPQLNQLNFENYFSERKKIKGQVKKMQFDLENVFIRRSAEYYRDITDIYEHFPFDLMIADIMCTAIPFVKEKLKVPVISIGITPIAATSKNLPPAGLGLTPSTGFAGKMKDALMRSFVKNIIFRKSNKLYKLILKQEGINPPPFDNMFDLLYKSSTLVLQSGTPGFEFDRSDLGENIRYVGPLLPYSTKQMRTYYLPYNYRKYTNKVLVTQGTVEKDPEKIIVPTLEAFRNTDTLVIATTGGSKTKELKERFPDANFIIEDFIPFNDVMPYCDVYITNGGYGGVMLGIQNKLPLVVAGMHEGKNEINARVGYFKLGVNLKTELPRPEQIREAVDEVLGKRLYHDNVAMLSEEFNRYDPNLLCEQYIEQLFSKQPLYREHRKAS
jgi:MGT family glycosyltransferase